MSVKFLLRNRFNSAVLASALLVGFGSAGCGVRSESEYIQDQRQQDAIIQQLEQRYPESSRLRTILEEQKKYYGTDAKLLELLADRGIDLDLSADGLPNGAVIRLFKNHWQINPFLTADMQAWAVHLALEYAVEQTRDGLPYGVGESFTVGNRVLLPVGNPPVPPPHP